MRMTDLELLESYDEKAEYPPPEAVLAAIKRLASSGEELAIKPLQRLIEYTQVQLFGWHEMIHLEPPEAEDSQTPSSSPKQGIRALYRKLHESMDDLITCVSRHDPPATGNDKERVPAPGRFEELPPDGALINLSDFTWECRNSATSRVLPIWVSTNPGNFFSVDLRAEAHLKRIDPYGYWHLLLRFEPSEDRPPTIPDVILTDRFELVNGHLEIDDFDMEFCGWHLSLREGV